MDAPAVAAGLESRLVARLTRIYGEQRAPGLARRLLQVLRPKDGAPRRLWDERDVVLITYGDTVTAHAERPLASLLRFLRKRLSGLVSTVHILPFYPYSSDGGFAVIDYREVDPMLGDWEDIDALCAEFDLMFDLVLNHVSSRSSWFSQFLGNRPPGRDYFHVIDPDSDLSAGGRPRETARFASGSSGRA